MQTPQPSPVSIALLSMIYIYRNTLSLLMLPSCRLTPSCSEYAMGAIERHGAVRGMALAARRLLRCRPFSRHVVDTLP